MISQSICKYRKKILLCWIEKASENVEKNLELCVQGLQAVVRMPHEGQVLGEGLLREASSTAASKQGCSGGVEACSTKGGHESLMSQSRCVGNRLRPAVVGGRPREAAYRVARSKHPICSVFYFYVYK